jgi:hypothetical protein
LIVEPLTDAEKRQIHALVFDDAKQQLQLLRALQQAAKGPTDFEQMRKTAREQLEVSKSILSKITGV